MINENIKACLFDLDGVIVFTDKYHYLAWKMVADKYGWDFDENVNNRLRGIPRLASLNEILKHNGTDIPMEEKEKVMKEKNDFYVELLAKINESDMYPGAVDFIKKLRERGVKIALCSSSKNADFVLEKLGLTELFDEVVTGNDITKAKPDPEIFLMAAERLRLPFFHCVVFEDSLAGIQGAQAAKMKTVGVGNREETEMLALEFITEYSEIDVETFIESGKKQPMKPDEFKLIEGAYNFKEVHHFESMFALVNGYMGVRGTYDESYDEPGAVTMPGTYINGIFESERHKHLVYFKGYAINDQYTVNLADWRIINVYVDGQKLGFADGKMVSHDRYLDMKNGKLVRSLVWETAEGKQLKVESTRIVNMEKEHTAQVRYTVTPINFSGDIFLESVVVKTTSINGKEPTENVTCGKLEDIFYSVTKTKNTNLSVAAAVQNQFICENECTTNEIYEENRYIQRWEIAAEKDSPITLEKFVAFYTSEDEVEDIVAAAAEDLTANLLEGFDSLASTQSEFWKAHWEIGDVKIEGNVADQQAVRFNLYQLRQQLPKSGKTSIGATGLTGPIYSGKVFWDTEMYIMPYLNYIDPVSTKPLLMYRYSILDKARERAQLMDGKGAMFSWCSIDGEETSVVFEASTAEYHLQSDIAYAIWRYYMSTKDTEFMNSYGNEILFETARYMFSRGEFIEATGGKFCINAVCGPDEYACGVNNNFYTNFLTKFHFEFAVKMYNDMKKNSPREFKALMDRIDITDEEAALWQKAADNMYYRYNEKLGIYEQDDNFVNNNTVDMELIPKNYDIRGLYHPLNLWRIQVLKQADVVLLTFVMGDRFTLQDKINNYEYYEPKTNHGSSLSAAVHSIIANEIGKEKDAYAYFRSSAYMDISDFKYNTYGGIHLACLGGVWMSVVNGFFGMRDYEKELLFNPSIPAAWDSCEVKVFYRGSRIAIKATHDKVTYTLVEGGKIMFKSGDTQVVLEKVGDTKEITK